MAMCPVFVVAYVALAFYLLGLVLSIEETESRDALTVREIGFPAGSEWTLPELHLSTVRFNSDVCVRVRVRMEPMSVNESLRIKFLELATNKNKAVTVKRRRSRNDMLKWWNGFVINKKRTKVQRSHSDHANLTQPNVWEMVYDCFEARPGHQVLVTVLEGARSLTEAFYTMQDSKTDAVPEFSVSVDVSSRRLTVRVGRGPSVLARLCYNDSGPECTRLTPNTHQTEKKLINPADSHTANLSFPFLLPCVCVQVYYIVPDASRVTVCPLKNRNLDGSDVWSSSSVKLYGNSSLEWTPLCPSSQSKPNISLCWHHHGNCVTIPNSTLQEKKLMYDLSAVDKHSQMCVKFSLNSSHHVHCPFQSGALSQWEVSVVPDSLYLRVYLTSRVPAAFAAQLCDQEGEEYVARGDVRYVRTEGGAAEMTLSFPFPYAGLCVQVWQSEPALKGRRLICPDYTHRRWGLVAGTALALLVTLVTLVCLTYRLVRKGVSAWRGAERRRPVLLVCSSDEACHVRAVCALASALQGELCVGVRLALWQQCGGQASLGQLGPGPWLYGQCRAVRRAGGTVLIAWSPDANRAYRRWREEREEERGRELEGKAEGESGGKRERWREEWMERQREGWSKGEREGERERSREGEREGERERSREACTVTAPVFRAALSCLEAGLQSDRRGHGFALLHLQGLSHGHHVPQDLRGVRRYCLPRDLPSLTRELGMAGGGVEDGAEGQVEGAIGGRCWPRFVSKAMSLWSSRRQARRLAHRLRAWPGRGGGGEEPRLMLKLSRKLRSDDDKKKKRKKRREGQAVSLRLPGERKGAELNATRETEQLTLPL